MQYLLTFLECVVGYCAVLYLVSVDNRCMWLTGTNKTLYCCEFYSFGETNKSEEIFVIINDLLFAFYPLCLLNSPSVWHAYLTA